MKVPVLRTLILFLGLSSSLPAIERPKILDDPQEQPREQPERTPIPEIGDRPAQDDEALPGPDANRQVAPAPDAAPATAWLGVLSEPIDEALGVHLDLEAGCMLNYVAEGSPAAKAGLQRHDIIVQVDGAGIANQDDLREAIQACQPGDEISLGIVSKGQKEERKVMLGERPAPVPAPAFRGDRPGVPVPEEFGLGARFPDLQGRMKDLENLVPGGGADLQKQLDHHMQRLEKHLQQMDRGGDFQLDLELFDDLPKPGKGAFNFDFKASSSFKFFDGEGSVEMKTRDGGKEVVVRDKEGNVLFEGPWDTPQDKGSAPEPIRKRIEDVNNGNRFNFRLENLPEPKMEIPEEKKRNLE